MESSVTLFIMNYILHMWGAVYITYIYITYTDLVKDVTALLLNFDVTVKKTAIKHPDFEDLVFEYYEK